VSVSATRAARFAASRLVIHFIADSAAWAAALTFGTLLRFDLHIERVPRRGVATAILFAIVVQGLWGLAFGLYTRRWRVGSFDEAAAIARTVAATTAVVFAIDVILSKPAHLVPKSAVVGAGAAALVLIFAVRYLWRHLVEAGNRPAAGAGRLLIFGAGEGGAQVITQMLRDPDSQFIPVAVLDDAHDKRHLRIRGVPVVGTRSDLASAAKKFAAETVLIAIPSADASLINELSELADVAGLTVKVLPSIRELLSGEINVSDIRNVTEVDLLGRHVLQTDVESIADYLTDKKVLVTGAGGSIGSELCRQIYRFAPAELIMVDRDESALHAVQLSIEGRALLDSPDLVLLDIRDRAALESVFSQRRPNIVFHAAALKHLPLLERHPREAVITNVWATLTMLEVAAASGVEGFINISSDKAAEPGSVLGYSKRIGERLTAYFSGSASGTYLSVRFGNVLGSRGSVLETFRAQIRAGGPITVTHPDVTRYFMTVEEAVQLVIQAGAIGRKGEVLVLDMGEPVRIAHVAHRLAANAERPIEMVFTGLRPGEKLHEILLASDEVDHRPIHPLISHVNVPPLSPDDVASLDLNASDAELGLALRRLCHAPGVLTPPSFR
jgi:FlaA1/EpsC-like NDP-sugar epimerase